MNHFVSRCYLMLMFGMNIIGLKEDYPENGVVIFYSGDNSFITKDSFKNTTQIVHMETINANLSVSHLLLTKNLEQNFRTLCFVLAKTKVVALLFPPGFNFTFALLLAQRRLKIPQLHLQISTPYNQNNMKLNLIPIPKDNVPTTMKILQKYSWSSFAVIYDVLDENREAKTLVEKHVQNTHDSTAAFKESIEFFQIVSELSTSDHTRQVTDILAKIKLSKTDKVLVYANADDVDTFLSIAKMMQMTGEDYNWILPWNAGRSMGTLPSNTMILRPKNTTKTKNLVLDAFEVIGRGFRDYCKEQTAWSIPSFGCFDSGDHEFGETFFRHLVRQSFVGKTGNIEFDDKGNRINTDYELVELTKGGIVCRDVSEAATTISPVKEKKKLRAVTALTEPFTFMNNAADNHTTCGTGFPCKLFSTEGNTTEQFCCDGMAIELLRMLETDLFVDIELHLSKDGKYGILDTKTNKWNGMIGELIRNEADVVVSDLTITDDRTKVVDFTQPFMEVGVGIMVRVERQSATKGMLGFLQPVAAQLWITVFASISMMGILFWVMEKVAIWFLYKDSSGLKGPAHFSIGASLHYSWSTVVRTRDRVTRPSTTSAMIGAIGLALCFLVFITTYTAQLAAFLVAEEHVSPLTRGIQDSKLQNPPDGLKIATVSGTSLEAFFRTTSDPLFSNIWRHMKDNNVPTTDMGIERLSARDIDVFFGDYSTLVYNAAKDKDCALRVVGEPIFQSGFGVAFQKNSSWTSIASQKLLEYQKYDVVLTLSHRWLKQSCEDSKKNTADLLSANTFRRMSSYDLSGVFLMVVTGVVLSLALLLTEYYALRRNSKKRAHASREGGRVTGDNEFQTSELF